MPPSSGRGSQRPGKTKPVEVNLPITVGQFVKLAGFADSGGEAKLLVVEGQVLVNGEVEVRRGHKLVAGDVVQVGGHAARVVVRPGGQPDRRSEQG